MLKLVLFYASILLIIVTVILTPARRDTLQTNYIVYVTSDFDANTITLWRVSAFTSSEKLLELKNTGASFFHLENDQAFITTQNEFVYETRYDLRDGSVDRLFTSADYIGRLVTVSPDGQWLYYIWDRDLFRLQVDGSRGELIKTGNIYVVYGWHNNTLIFTGNSDNNQMDLYFHDSDTPFAERVSKNISSDIELTQDAVLYSVKSESAQGTTHHTTYLQPFDGSQGKVIVSKVSRSGVWLYDGQRFYNSSFNSLEVYEPPDWQPHILNLPHFDGLYHAMPKILYYYSYPVDLNRLNLFSSDSNGQNVRLVIKNIPSYLGSPELLFHDDWVLSSGSQPYLAHKSGYGHYLRLDDYVSEAAWTNIPAPVPTGKPYLLFAVGCGMLLVTVVWRRIAA